MLARPLGPHVARYKQLLPWRALPVAAPVTQLLASVCLSSTGTSPRCTETKPIYSGIGRGGVRNPQPLLVASPLHSNRSSMQHSFERNPHP
jgi:hypothetical protein